MSLVLDGSSGVQYPTGSNYQVPALNMPSGSVVQVVQGTLSTNFSTSSSSYVTTGLTASITPLFSTSKILIMYNGSIASSPSSGTNAFTTIYRNSTNLEITSTRGFNESNFVTGNYNGTCTTGSFLDSPSTTSSTTYTVYLRSGSSSAILFAVDGSTATITLMEIR